MHDRLPLWAVPYGEPVSMSWLPSNHLRVQKDLWASVVQLRCHLLNRSFVHHFEPVAAVFGTEQLTPCPFQVHENTAQMYAGIRHTVRLAHGHASFIDPNSLRA
jgi:hypothetical protein